MKSPQAAGGWMGEIKPKFATAAWPRSLKTLQALKITPKQRFWAAKAFALARRTLAARSRFNPAAFMMAKNRTAPNPLTLGFLIPVSRSSTLW